MIETNIFKITPKNLFRLLTIRFVKKMWWFFLIIILYAIGSLFHEAGCLSVIFLLIGFMFPFTIILSYWRYIKSQNNQWLFNDVYFQIEPNKITKISDENTKASVSTDYLFRVEILQKMYLLLIADNHVLHIPINAFKTKADLEWFQNNILTKVPRN